MKAMWRSISRFASILILAVAFGLFTGPGQDNALAEASGIQPWGTWVWHYGPEGSGLPFPALVTFHQDGTLICSDSMMFGGFQVSPFKTSPIQGVWERTGPKSFGGTSLYMIFVPTTGVAIMYGRARSSLHFGEDCDHIYGEMVAETLSILEDPLDPDASWEPYPVTFLISGARLHRVPIDQP
jgi:hypothetical protein